MKRQIFLVCLFYCFFRLPIYESIAAIFWQSASYVSEWSILKLSSVLQSSMCVSFSVARSCLFSYDILDMKFLVDRYLRQKKRKEEQMLRIIGFVGFLIFRSSVSVLQ